MKKNLIITILFLVSGHSVYAMHHAKRDELDAVEAGYGKGAQRSHPIFNASRFASQSTPPGRVVCVPLSESFSSAQSSAKPISFATRIREQRAGSIFARGAIETSHRTHVTEIDIESQEPIYSCSNLERCKMKFTAWWAGLSQAQKDTAIVGGLTLLTAGTTLGCYYLGIPVVVAKTVCYITGEAVADTLQRLKYYQKLLIGLPLVLTEEVLHDLQLLPSGAIADETGITILAVTMFWVHGGFSDLEALVGLPNELGQSLTELPGQMSNTIDKGVV